MKPKRRQLCGRERLLQIKIDWCSILNADKQEASVYKIDTLIMDTLKNKDHKVFSSSVGKIKDLQTRIYVKPNTTPKFIKARRVSLSLMEAVEKQLEKIL